MFKQNKILPNALYIQSGGMTSVINNTAYTIIQTVKKYPKKINKLYAGIYGIVGVLEDNLIDTSTLTEQELEGIKNSPGGVFGTSRYKIKSLNDDLPLYKKLVNILKKYNIHYIFYNGGNDSADTALKLSKISSTFNYKLCCIAVPKTIDNDIACTDVSPGFGSSAKYIATSMYEASIDLKSMCKTSTKVFIMEIMGRHTGWLTAASAVWKDKNSDPPHICLLPEILFNQKKFLKMVSKCVNKYGYCSIAVSEGLKNENNIFLSDKKIYDSFEHVQLGGVALILSEMVQNELGYKCHYSIPDYLQRAGKHLCSKLDIEIANAVGKAAVEFAIQDKNNVMPCIKTIQNKPYKYKIEPISLNQIANVERKLPNDFIDEENLTITTKCKEYITPFISGEIYPKYDKNGKPFYISFT